MSQDCAEFVYHAWLASAQVSPPAVHALLAQYQTPEEIYDVFSMGALPRTFVPEATRNALRISAAPDNLQRLRTALVRHQIRAVTVYDARYPAELLKMGEPPVILFYQGNLDCLKGRLLAMVGSRAASYEGKTAARVIARDLSRRGVSVVSGLAGGIDSASHAGCLEGGSPTVAVMGNGLDIVYPADNVPLRDRILKENGLLLSEYPPGEKPLGWHFPYRNRIITGLSQALIVVEARIRSGTMTSVQHALDQGRDVFVYPGNPASPYSEGNHQLLREGALYFTTAEDILEDLGWLDNPEIIGQNSECSQEKGKDPGPEEAAVLSALRPGQLGFEQLVALSGLSPSSLMSALTLLQLSGRVEALPGKIYRIRE